MPLITRHAPDADVRSLLATLSAGTTARGHRAAGGLQSDESAPVSPFVTISRQAGAGGLSLGRRLTEQLNRLQPDDAQRWTCWDREVVERVSAHKKISRDVIDSLEEADHSWLDDFLAGLGTIPGPSDESVLFRQTAATIRALAQAGRVVIVGCGSVFLTRTLPGGLHVRIIAPYSYRVNNLARILGFSRSEAEAEVHRRDHNRDNFYCRYFPKEVLVPETFTITLNSGAMDENEMAASLMPLINNRIHNGRRAISETSL